MSKEFTLRKTFDGACLQHFTTLRDAQKENVFESNASIIIQKHWRSYAVRRNMEAFRRAAVEIQAGCRGRAGRVLAHQYSLKAASSGRTLHFHEAATKIQKCWRGRSSRQQTHSFYGRERYINSILRTNWQLRRVFGDHVK